MGPGDNEGEECKSPLLQKFSHLGLNLADKSKTQVPCQT